MTALSSLNIDLESSHDRDDFIDDAKKKKKRKGMFSSKKDLLIDKDTIIKEKDKEKKDRKSKREKSSSVTHVGGVSNSSAPANGTPVVGGSIIGSDVISGDLSSSKAISRSSIDSLTADDDSPTSVKTPKKLGTPGKAAKDKEKKHKSKVAGTQKTKPPPGPPAPNYVPGPPVMPRTTSAAGSESPLRVGLSAEASIVMARRNQQAHTNPSGRVGLTGEGAIIMKQRKKKYNTLPTDLSKIGRRESVDDTGLHRADTLEEMEYVDQTGDFGIASGSLKLGRSGSPSLQVSHTVEWRGKQLPVEVSLASFDTVCHSVAQAFGIDLEFMKSICLSLKLEYCLPGEGGDYIEISEENLNLTLAGAGGILRVVVVDDD